MSIWTHVAGIIRVDHIPSLANNNDGYELREVKD